ncbi:MAG: Ig-like domain-containing protein [Cyclobacteriaceae bacterium]|nr:Ig-like domain-containing protein [Cyclobacteriaceae bacterium SS2]
MRRVLFVLFTLTVSSLIGQSVTSVNSSTANGTYIIGEVISIQVNFSGAVQVTGAPQLTLSTGAVVDYTSGSGTSTLTFNYTIGTGEISSDLAYASTAALGPTGSIKDNATGLLNATLTLPTPGALNSLSANKNLVVDGVLPTFQNAHFFDTNGDGNIDEVVIEMSEPVDHTTAEAADFTLTGGSISGVESSGAASNSLDVSDADQYVTLTASLTGTGTANIDYSKTGGATLQLADLAGNEADNDATITEVDAAAPVIIQAVTADNNSNGYLDRITLTFSENIDDGNSGGFTSTTVDIAGYTGEAKVSGDDDNAEVIISFSEGGSPDTDATPSITLLSGQVVDADLNAIASNQIFSSTEDGAAPVIVSATTVDDDLNGQIDGIELVMSEPVDDTGSTLDGTSFDLETPYDNNNPTASTGDTGNDAILFITFDEEGSADTDAVPDVTLIGNKVQDLSIASNQVGSNVLFGSTVDGAIPVLLLASTSPAANASGVSVNSARTFSFDFSENVDAIGSNLISIYNTDDLVNPIYSADVTDAEVDVTGSTVTWSHNELLDKGESFAVGIDAGAFEDQSAGNLPSDELLNSGDNKWEWSMDNTGGPRYVYSPQHNTTTVAPYGLIYFYYDEPVRLQNSSNKKLRMDRINGFGGSDLDNNVIDEDIDYNGNPVVSFILPYPSNTSNYTKQKIFDISETSYNGGSYMPGSFYEITVDADAFEDTGDNDSDGFEIEFQIDGSDVDRPTVLSFLPADDPSEPATIDVDIETTTELVINFDEPMGIGFGNIRLYADVNPDVLALNIPSSSPLVSIIDGPGGIGASVEIDISGITLAGNIEYYVEIDRSAFTDAIGNTFAGFSDETTWNFKMEPELNAPEISSLSPADNATGVDVDSDLVMVFNEPVKEGVGGNLNVRLSSNGYIVETIPSSSFTFDGTSVTIPLSQLGGLSGYYVNIDQDAIADLGDNKFPGITGSFAWSFTTASEAIAPSGVTSTFSPADGSSGASVGTNISFYFDEVVSPIAGNNIEIRRESDDMLIEQFDVTDPEITVSGNQVIINPSSDLSFLTEYYVVVDAGAFEDASGNLSLAVGGDGNWNFTTGADASNPFILTLSPDDDATGVALSPVITIGFSESVVDQGSGVVNLLYTDGSLAHQLDLSDFDFSDNANPSIDLNAEGITLSGNTIYYVEIPNTAFEDLSGLAFAGVAGNGNWSFTTTSDAVAPLPTGTPTGASVAVSTDLTLTFPEPVTANAGNITVRYADLTIVEIISVSSAESSMGKTVHTLELDEDLSGGILYYVDVDAGAFVDNSGNNSIGLTGSTDWSFTTDDDGVSPSIVSLSPANDATGVATGAASLVMTFNEPVVLGSGNVVLSYDDGVTLETFTTGDVILSNGNTVATIGPYGVLDGMTEYYVAVDNGFFEDNDGSPNAFPGITGDGSWSFFTGTDAVAPSASGGVTPANGTSGNPVDPTITITLNERVYAGSGEITISGGGQTISINVLDGTQITGFGTNVVSINPTESLINGTTYTVTVPAGAFEDPSGNTNSLISWFFDVGNATIVTASNTVICVNEDYVALNDLVITETSNTDFLVGTGRTITITLPAQFEFNTLLTPSVNISGSDLSAGSAVVGLNTMTLTYTTDGQSGGVDEITISNIEVRYTGSTAGIYNAYRTGGTANMKGNNVVHGQPHFVFDVNDPPAPPTVSATFWQPDGSEDLLVPSSVPGFNVTATGVGSITWYNNDFSVSASATSGASFPYTSLPGLNPDNSYGTFVLADEDPALYTFYVTDNDGTCESDPFKRNILVLEYLQTPGGFSFVDDGSDVVYTVSEPDNHEVTTSGLGITDITDTPPSTSITFSPSSVGAGSYPIEIITTNNYTGESVALPRDLTVTATAKIFKEGTELDVDYCKDEGVLVFSAYLDDIPSGEVFYGFALDNVIIPHPGFLPNRAENDSIDWMIDLNDLTPGVHAIQRLVVAETALFPSIQNYPLLEADLNVFPLPTVTINELEDYYCEDGLPVNLTARVTNQDLSMNSTSVVVDVNSYRIEKLTGVGAPIGPITISGSPAQFNPANPLGNGTDAVGTYRITYLSEAGDDPNEPTPVDSKGCQNTYVREVEVLATPDLPVLTNDLTGIGGEDGDRINLQFCVGDVIPDLVVSADPDEQITWYTSNLLNTTYNSVGTQGEILKAEELFGTDQPNSAFNVNIYITKTDYINDGIGFEGCESPPKVINIRVYEEPSVPALDVTQDAATRLSSTSYLFEYCDTYGGDNVTFSSTLPDIESYYRFFDASMTFQANLPTDSSGWPVSSFEFSEIGFSGMPGTDTTIFISRVLNDSTWIDSGAQFSGCESGFIELEIRVYETSPAPDTTLFATSRTDYYICSGEDLGTITSPGEQDTRYAWYEDDGSGTAPDYGARMTVAAFDDRFIVQNSLANEFVGFSNENLTTSPITYTYWITQFQDYNDETGYIGCESEPSKLTITVFPDPGAPTFDDPGVTYMDWDIANAHLLEISYCEGNIGQSIELNLNGNTDAEFNWYRSDATGTTRIGNSVHDHIASQPVKTSELKITDAEEADGVIYFVVTQTNNSQPLGADFDGCETELDEMAFVIINTYDIPAMPQTIDNDYTYCEDDVVANGIELTGEPGVTFNWYKADVDGNMESTPFHIGSTANDTELGLLGDNGTGRYLFWVTQTQNIGDGVATFEGCESAPRLITVYEVPPEMDDIRFSSDYINSSEGFCVDVLQGAVIINYSGVEDALFTWYDQSMTPIVDRTLSAETFINTGASGVGSYTFYVSQTINSCESELHEVTFNIYDTPATPEFDLASNGTLINPQYEFIYCRDQDVSGETLLISNGQTGNIYEWYFNESLTEPITQNIDESDQSIAFTNLGISGVDDDQLAKTPGTYSRYVRSQESTECYSPVRRFDMVVGEAPDVAFTWDGLMKGKPVDFTFINDNPEVDASDIDEVRFTVGVDIPYHAFSYADNQVYETTFMDAGEYTVELFMRTSDVCRDSVTRTVTVLDIIEVPEDGLLETFEDPNHGWFAEYRTLNGKQDTQVNSWELGKPSTSTLNAAFSGDNAWVTNLDGDYTSNEISWVYSPAFDITNLTIPIVSFYHQHWLFNNRDAVVFQYSTDNGASWFKLGDFSEIAGGIVETSGLNWYTHADIPTQPGYYNVNSVDFNQSYNPSSFGWSSTQQPVQREEDRVSEWLLSINKMDNADTVIFRFALSSSGGDEDEGFAFDDFRVYNSDKITLLESFYNATETGVVTAYQDLREQVDNQSVGSVAWINYFTELDMTSSSGRDDINRSNSVDPSARVGYYGINESPRSALEGEVQKLEGIDTESELYIRGFTPSALGVAGLESKKFDITNFHLDTSAPSDILRASATFTAVQDFPGNNEFSIRFMVIEKEITGVTVGEFSENDTLRNVLRKILPSAGGIVKQGAMTLGTSFTETVEWKINNVYDPTQLDVIAFIQNENATNGRREIFQAAVLNGDFSNKELILGVLDQLRNGDPFVIYPNPVDNQFKLEILNPVKDAMDWKMFDQTGKEVLKGQLPGGELSIDIETKQLPSGVFLIQLTNGDVIYEPKRIAVIHE